MSKSRPLLKESQRELFLRIPDDLSDRECARYYTLSSQDLHVIKTLHGSHNKLGFAVQLCLLRFPGRTLTEITYIPDRVLNYIAEQLSIDVERFAVYGQRQKTVSDHLSKIRSLYGYREYDWPEMLLLARRLLPVAMESEQRLPLIEVALSVMRQEQIIAPAMSTVEHLVWGIHRIARKRVYKCLVHSLSLGQKKGLAATLKKGGKSNGRIQLGWLREAPALSTSPDSLGTMLDRIAFIRDLHLPSTADLVPPNRIREMARRCRQYTPQALKKMKPKMRRYALLTAYLSALPRDLIDQALDMFDRTMSDLLRKGERKQETHLKQNAKALNANIQILGTAVEAFLEAFIEKLEPFETVFSAVSEEELVTALIATKAIVRPPDGDALDLIEGRYGRRRKTMLQLYRLLKFTAVSEAEPVLKALDHIVRLADENKRVVAVEQQIKTVRVKAPIAHMMRTRWRKHALKGKTINPNYYELAAFDLLKARLRSGDIAVAGSRRYQDFNSDLLSWADFRWLRENKLTRLSLTGTAQEYFDEVHHHFQSRMADLTANFASNPALRLGDNGEIILVPYETETPEAAKKFRRKLYKRLPIMQMPDLCLEVDGWTDCLRHFVDPTTGQPPVGRETMVLLAAIMALGMNIGLKKMAQATSFSYAELSGVADRYIREETLSRAMRDLDNFALRLPMSQFWGDGSTSSSDGMRLVVPVKAANADYNARYFGSKRGLTILTHTADIQMPFGPKIISTNERQALYTIDLLCNHETDLNIMEHYTDTAGYTFHVFSMCAFLGFRFAPDIRSMTDQYLYSVEPAEITGPFAKLYKGVADTELIEELWEESQRFAASIRLGTASAALMMRKLASYPRQNRLAKALYEIGKLERTLFILDYLYDKSFRKRIRAGLNKGELLHALARALFFGRRGEMREKNFEDQFNRASCLMLLIGMISVWNSVYLQKSWETTQAENLGISDEFLPFVSPLSWDHINFLGQYLFDFKNARSLDDLRTLRSPRKYQTVGDPEHPLDFEGKD